MPVSSPTPTRLIISADDFGMSAGINAAVLRAHRDGVLTEAGLMVTGRGAADAVALARGAPSLGVGLHLVLVQGHAAAPAAELPGLTDAQGRFGDHPTWAGLRYFFTPGVRAQLRREIRAQLEAFRATGLPLSHVDGHLTIHLHPAVLGILVEAAATYGIRAVRLPRDPLGPALRYDRRHAGRKLFEATAFTLLSRFARRRLAAAGIRHADTVFGLHQTGHVTENYLLDLLPRLRPGVTEIYCHAGVPDDESRRWRPANYEDEAELAALCSPRVRAALAAAGVELIGYQGLTG